MELRFLRCAQISMDWATGATAAPRTLSHAVSVSTPYPLPPYFCL